MIAGQMLDECMMTYPNYGSKFMNTFFPYISKIWNNLPSSTKSMSLFDFKAQLKNDLKR